MLEAVSTAAIACLDEWYPEQQGTSSYTTMMRDLSQLQGDELDQAFLEDMITHHHMAVMMSRMLLYHGLVEHEAVYAFAEQIAIHIFNISFDSRIEAFQAINENIGFLNLFDVIDRSPINPLPVIIGRWQRHNQDRFPDGCQRWVETIVLDANLKPGFTGNGDRLSQQVSYPV